MAGVKLTVVSLIDNESVETYVGVIQGGVPEDERKQLAERYGAFYGADYPGLPSVDTPEREMVFREVEQVHKAAELDEFLNHDDTGMGGVKVP
jgi:hypothetical protein